MKNHAKTGNPASHHSDLVHATPCGACCYTLRDCCKPRLHADVLPLLTRAQVLERVGVVIANVPNHPVWHVRLRQAQASMAAVLQHNCVCSAAIQELDFGLAINCHLLALLSLSASEDVTNANVHLFALQALNGALSTRLAAEVCVQTSCELQWLWARVHDFHLQVQRLSSQRHRVNK